MCMHVYIFINYKEYTCYQISYVHLYDNIVNLWSVLLLLTALDKMLRGIKYGGTN